MSSLVSCAQISNRSPLFMVCDPQMNDQREELAEQLFKDMKVEDLLELANPCAEAGNSYYQFSLGTIYINESMMAAMNRKGDPKQAFKWFIKAAEQGHEDAILILMDAYEGGDMGLAKDETQYIHWKKKLYDVQKKMN